MEDFLKKLLGSMGPAAPQQYPMSPMDPMKDQTPMLSSMLSPAGIQAPLYNYTQSPEENMIQGTALSMPVSTTADKMAQMAMPSYDISQPAPLPASPMAMPKAIGAQSPAMPQLPDIQSQPETPMTPPVETKPPGPSAEDILAQLQGDRKSTLAAIQMAEAADRIGQAMAGQGNLKYEGGRFEGAKQLAGMDLSDFLERDKFKKDNTRFDLDTEKSKLDIQKAKSQMGDEQAQRDPKSELSQVARASVIDSLNRIGRKDLASKITSNMSSKQVEDLFGQNNLANMVSQFEANENRKEMAAARAADKKDQAATKEEQRKENFITQRYDKVLTSPQYKGMTKIAQARKVIDDALKNPNGITDIGALYSVIKLFDPESVVREGELKLTDGAKSVWTQANTAISKLGKNPRILDKNVLAKMKQAADTIYGETIQQYKTEITPVLNQAKARGISEQEYGLIDPLYDTWKNDTSGSTMTITPDVQNKAMEEIKRRQGK